MDYIEAIKWCMENVGEKVVSPTRLTMYMDSDWDLYYNEGVSFVSSLSIKGPWKPVIDWTVCGDYNAFALLEQGGYVVQTRNPGVQGNWHTVRLPESGYKLVYEDTRSNVPVVKGREYRYRKKEGAENV
jgi:hypothetical protein